MNIKIHKLSPNETTEIQIDYETTEKCTAIQWLEPSQTAGKVHPYLFTQCQAIHCRSILPCQDTPGVKMTYNASVKVPDGMTALMSAVPAGKTQDVFAFEQKIAIPSYLLALAVGEIVGVKVGPRSTVWSEPSVVNQAAWEFEETEDFVSAGESFLTPYCWGVYDLLVLPASFPYGGMENPCLTFVTPTLLAGDRTLVDVVAHEIAHSWMGNLVTTKNWEHFWLNEGFTVFIERKITSRIGGEAVRCFNAIIGLQHLKDSVDHLCSSGHPEYTCLCPKLEGVDPDDVFSSVPYEKGFNLLFYLEKLVGGPAVFEPFVKAYVIEYSHKVMIFNQAITTAEFKSFLFSYFTRFENGAKIALLEGVDWDSWFHKPGMPPIDNQFDRELVKDCEHLVEQWTKAIEPTVDWNVMNTNQRVMFFDLLISKAPLSLPTLASLNTKYTLSANNNAEVKFKWQSLCLASGDTSIFPHVIQFITGVGRMKFVRPLYRALFACKGGQDLARQTFIKHRTFYHPICANMVAKDLGV